MGYDGLLLALFINLTKGMLTTVLAGLEQTESINRK